MQQQNIAGTAAVLPEQKRYAAADQPVKEGGKGVLEMAKEKIQDVLHIGRRITFTSLPMLVKPRGGLVMLPELPFDWSNGVAPVFSKHQFELHYLKHHKSYVDNFNMMLGDDTQYDGLAIEEIVRKLARGPLFNMAAQHFNHTFFWQCMKPNAGGDATIPPEFANCLMACFGSIANFKNEFQDAAGALKNFGSGWTWLVYDITSTTDRTMLKIVNTHDAETPITSTNYVPLLCADVWEHAYYVDFEDRRNDYLLQFWNIVNWNFVANEFIRCRGCCNQR